MSEPGLISVVIPCYNYGAFIAETLGSVLAQSYRHWECIVVDDGSTDNSAQIVEPFLVDARIKYVFQSNQGLSAARNTGITQTSGQFIQFLDADDLLAPDKLQNHIDGMARFPQAGITYSDYRYFASDRPTQLFPSLDLGGDNRLAKISGAGDELLAALVRANIMPVNAALVNRALIEKVGLFDTKLKSLEDWDLWLRCALIGEEIHYLGEWAGGALIRVHDISMSRSKRVMFASELSLRTKISAALRASNDVSINTHALEKLNRKCRIRTLSWLMREYEFEYSQMLHFLRTEGLNVFLKAYLRAIKKPAEADTVSIQR